MSNIFLGTVDGLHVLGPDGPESVLLRGRRVTGLGAGVAVVDGAAVFREGEEGWAPLAEDGVTALTALHAGRTGILVGTADARLLRVAGDGFAPVDSFDRVPGRDRWYTPWGGPAATRSIAEDAAGVLYVNVHVGGVVVSADGGASWSPSGMDIDADAHQVLVRPGQPHRVLAACAVGLGISDDAGETWRYETTGLHGTYLRAVAMAGGTILVTASEGPRGERSALYRRPAEADPGDRFDRCGGGLPEWLGGNVDTGCLAADGETVVFGSPAGAVYRSADAGVSWELVARDLPTVTALALAPA